MDLKDDELDKWTEINKKYSLIWPVITEKKDALENAKEFDGAENKFEKYFSEAPGGGDL